MHIPVLQKEVLQYLNPQPNENFIDATVGGAGHASAILEKTAPKGKVLGLDQDPEQIKNAQLKIKNFKQRAILADNNFANLGEVVRQNKLGKVKGILFDLGMSSWHLSESGRGFSFQKREPLDMRYNPGNQLTAAKIINYWSKFELERIFKDYGEEKFAQDIAEKIVEERSVSPIMTTLQLVGIIGRAMPKRYLHGRIHFATRIFQALRIAVNDELTSLEKALPQALEILEPGGRLVVISFHSLEDRIVKNFFKNVALKPLTKKPITPSWPEIKINPRARSARLRAAIKL